MAARQDITTPLHTRTKRDYVARMMDEKATCMRKAKQYGADYWDGHRRFGYGGYNYDGRWLPVARKLVESYELASDVNILDVGCGKGYLLYELSKLLPEAKVVGLDSSAYALSQAKPEIMGNLSMINAQALYPFETDYFDLVLSINTLHNLEIFDLKKALQEITRVGRRHYICVESYRNEQELFNLQCWALTCEAFYSTRAWEWLLKEFGYPGDYEFIYFE